MPDESGSLVRLAGSERAPLPGASAAGALDTSQQAEVTVVVRRRAELPAEIVAGPTVLTSDELAERYGADPADVALVRQELTSRGLEVTAVDYQDGSQELEVIFAQARQTGPVTVDRDSSGQGCQVSLEEWVDIADQAGVRRAADIVDALLRGAAGQAR